VTNDQDDLPSFSLLAKEKEQKESQPHEASPRLQIVKCKLQNEDVGTPMHRSPRTAIKVVPTCAEKLSLP
jgi:hypothetical protein